jgi:hypothetical protein
LQAQVVVQQEQLPYQTQVLLFKVDALFVGRGEHFGLLHQQAVKYQEIGIVEPMQTQEHNRYLVVLDGLYPLAYNFKVLDMSVELFGIRSLLLITGLIHSPPLLVDFW